MEESSKMMLVGNAGHHIHHQLVVIVGYVYFFKQRSNFKLTWCNFIVTRAYRDT